VKRLMGHADRYPATFLLGSTVSLYFGLLAWSHFDHEQILLSRAKPDHRVEIYGQFATSAVALLGVVLTVLAILLALPDRPILQDLRNGGAWPRIQSTLLAAALLCLVTLVTAHLGDAIDNATRGRTWLSMLMLATATTSVIAILTGGGVFALFLRIAQQPRDPSDGRGC
jgi:hypothetical protein